MATFIPSLSRLHEFYEPVSTTCSFKHPVIPPNVDIGTVHISKQQFKQLDFDQTQQRTTKLPHELYTLKPHRILDDLWRAMAFGSFAYISRIYMQATNDVQVYRKHVLKEAVLKRSHGQPLVTVTNHNSCVDDPTMFAMVAPIEVWRDSRSVRWAFCASEVCFKTPLLQSFFTATKTSPVYRGCGLEQAPVQFAIERLRNGDWYHIFPEGHVVQQNNYRLARCKWGVGKILSGVKDLDPIVVPFVHKGMEELNPLPGRTFKVGKKARAIVGDPIPLKDLFENFEKLQENNPGWGDPFPPSEELLYHQVTNRISNQMSELIEKLDHVEEHLQSDN